jgi:hypothetical protein
MKYFLDQEFIEGFRKPISWLPSFGWFNKRYWTIELISIGIYSEDKRLFYAVNKDFNARYASDWVKKNVLSKLPPRRIGEPVIMRSYDAELTHGGTTLVWQEENPVYQTLEQIKEGVMDFVGGVKVNKYHGDMRNMFPDEMKYRVPVGIEFYGYYADYDWVLFCSSLFGTMMNLPKDMPMFCYDLKQIFDEHCKTIAAGSNRDYKWWGNNIKNMSNYPKETNEHDASADAEWNYKLYKFLEVIEDSV